MHRCSPICCAFLMTIGLLGADRVATAGAIISISYDITGGELGNIYPGWVGPITGVSVTYTPPGGSVSTPFTCISTGGCGRLDFHLTGPSVTATYSMFYWVPPDCPNHLEPFLRQEWLPLQHLLLPSHFRFRIWATLCQQDTASFAGDGCWAHRLPSRAHPRHAHPLPRHNDRHLLHHRQRGASTRATDPHRTGVGSAAPGNPRSLAHPKTRSAPLIGHRLPPTTKSPLDQTPLLSPMFPHRVTIVCGLVGRT